MKKKKKMILLVLLLMVSVGYALLSANIGMIGVTKVKDAKWKIFLDNLRISKGSVEVDSSANINVEKDSVNYSVLLNTPGDYFEFLVDVVNDGSIDGMIDAVTSQIKINGGEFVNISPSTIPSYLNYSVSYKNGGEIQRYHELNAGDRQTYKIRVEYKKNIDVNDLPTSEQNLEFTFGVNFIQKDVSSVSVPDLKVGDYVNLVPDVDNYIIDKDISGFNSNQTIHPKELSLWKIIRKNDDDTFDAISEYVSSTDITLNGIKGYKNLPFLLQEVANQYMKSGYTTKARCIGNDGQTSKLDDTSAFDGSSTTTSYKHSSPLTSKGEGAEFNNGVFGDSFYISDFQLVKNAYNGNLPFGCRVNDNVVAPYWLSSRSYIFNNDSDFSFGGYYISQKGLIANDGILRSYNNSWDSLDKSFAFRPIITFNSNLLVQSGSGTIDKPYQFK